MKINLRTPLLVAVIAFSLYLAGQDPSTTLPNSIVGYWQEGTAETSDTRPNCYRFFNDGKFTFELSKYDESKRILSLHGTYRVKDGLLLLTITHRIELQGGAVVWNPQARNGWSIQGGKSVRVIQTNSQEEEVSLETCSVPGKQPCVKIGGDKYSQTSKTPKAQ